MAFTQCTSEVGGLTGPVHIQQHVYCGQGPPLLRPHPLPPGHRWQLRASVAPTFAEFAAVVVAATGREWVRVCHQLHRQRLGIFVRASITWVLRHIMISVINIIIVIVISIVITVISMATMPIMICMVGHRRGEQIRWPTSVSSFGASTDRHSRSPPPETNVVAGDTPTTRS